MPKQREEPPTEPSDDAGDASGSGPDSAEDAEADAADTADGADPEADAADTEADAESDGSTDEHATTHLAPAGAIPARHPPRRTGVFLDADELRSHVGDLLRTILGGYEVDAFGNFTFTHEDARVFVTVGPSPVGPQIGVFSVTNLDLDLDLGLAGFLLTTNHSLGFGAFSYDPRNRAVWLRHTLLGTALDLPELHTAVGAIASTAAALDERIRDRFGGRTFQEAPEDVQQRMEPPDSSGGSGFPSATGYL